MALQLVFHRLAAKEARAAEEWYRSRSSEAADRFRIAVLEAAQRIADNVGNARGRQITIRYVLVRRFPYRLVYCLEAESTALVVAVSHLRRRPTYWRQRTAEH